MNNCNLLITAIMILFSLHALCVGVSCCLLWTVYGSDDFSDNHFLAFQKKHPKP